VDAFFNHINALVVNSVCFALFRACSKDTFVTPSIQLSKAFISIVVNEALSAKSFEVGSLWSLPCDELI